MREFQLKQTMQPGRTHQRYSANGKRISRNEYEHIMRRGFMHGHVDCFATQCKEIGNGEFRRVNYVSVRY